MVDVTQVTIAGIGAAMQLALAVWIHSASQKSRVNRGFAIFLFAQGLGDVTHALHTQDRLLAGSSWDIGLYGAAEGKP